MDKFYLIKRESTFLVIGFLVLVVLAFTGPSQAVAAQTCVFKVSGVGYTSPCAIAVGGSLKISGDAIIQGSSGSVHSNTDIDISGNPQVSQDVTASGSINVSGNPVVGGSITSGVDPTNVPSIDPNDFGPYVDYQLRADGKVYQTDGNGGWTQIADLTSGGDWNGWDYSSPKWTMSKDTTIDGTLFVEGDAVVSANPGSSTTPWEATIIATGFIEVSGNPVMVTNPNNPQETQNLLFVAGKDLKVNGNPLQDLQGIMAAHEQMYISGNPTLRGCLFIQDAEDVCGLVSENDISGVMNLTYDGMTSPFGTDQEIPITEPY